MNTTLDNTQVKVSTQGTPLPGGKISSIAEAQNEDKHFVVVKDAVENEIEGFKQVDDYEGAQQLERVGKKIMEEIN